MSRDWTFSQGAGRIQFKPVWVKVNKDPNALVATLAYTAVSVLLTETQFLPDWHHHGMSCRQLRLTVRGITLRRGAGHPCRQRSYEEWFLTNRCFLD